MWRALVAGAVAGLSMLLTGLEDQHTSLAIYILMRAAVLASRCGIKSKRFGKICKPLTWKHGDIFLMCLSSSQILYVIMLLTLSLSLLVIFTEEIVILLLFFLHDCCPLPLFFSLASLLNKLFFPSIFMAWSCDFINIALSDLMASYSLRLLDDVDPGCFVQFMDKACLYLI